MSEQSQAVLWQKRDQVVYLTLNREERRNAINDEVIEMIRQGIEDAVSDTTVRAIVLTGTGDRAFCAGGDLTPSVGNFKYDYSTVGSPFATLLKYARDLTVPLIARVNGHCLAGGMGLLGMCDMAVAADHAKFGLPEVKIGLFPMQVLSVVQPIIPARKLNEMAITGEPVTAQEALELGLVNYVVPKGELDEKVDWLLGRILDKSPTAIRRGKYAMRTSESLSFDQAIVFLQSQIGISALTEDAAEGLNAFAEKRKPVWTGR